MYRWWWAKQLKNVVCQMALGVLETKHPATLYAIVWFYAASVEYAYSWKVEYSLVKLSFIYITHLITSHTMYSTNTHPHAYKVRCPSVFPILLIWQVIWRLQCAKINNLQVIRKATSVFCFHTLISSHSPPPSFEMWGQPKGIVTTLVLDHSNG